MSESNPQDGHVIGLLSPLGLPCQAPAWGYVAAVDLTNNEVIWKHKNGTVRDSSDRKSVV